MNKKTIIKLVLEILKAIVTLVLGYLGGSSNVLGL